MLHGRNGEIALGEFGVLALGCHDLARQDQIVACPRGVGGVLEDGDSVAGSLGELDVGADGAREDLAREIAADLGQNLPGKLQAGVVESGQDAGDVQVRVDAPPHQLDDLHQLADALQGEELRLKSDNHLMGSGQAIDGQEAQAGRAVQDDVVGGGLPVGLLACGLPGINGLPEQDLTAEGARQLDFGPRQVDVGRQELQSGGCRLLQTTSKGLAPQEQVVGGGLARGQIGSQV